MIIQIVLFAMAREISGESLVEIELGETATVGDVKRELAVRYPGMSELVSRSAISVDHEFAIDSQILGETSEVALIPPVSGG